MYLGCNFLEETHIYYYYVKSKTGKTSQREKIVRKYFNTQNSLLSQNEKKHIPFTQRYIRNSSNGVENDTSLARKILMVIMLKMLKLKRRDQN